MKDKIALVTGANGGLGTSVTQALLDAGATVVGLSRKIEQSDFASPNFTALPGEISTASGAKAAMDAVVSRFGRLDILAHTVGGFAGAQSIADTDDATFQQMFDINLNSAFYILRAAIPVAEGRQWTHCGDRQPGGAGARRGGRSIQCFQSRHGFADPNNCAGK